MPIQDFKTATTLTKFSLDSFSIIFKLNFQFINQLYDQAKIATNLVAQDNEQYQDANQEYYSLKPLI